jgi:hypothetical protein
MVSLYEVTVRPGTCWIAFIPQLHQLDVSLQEPLIRDPFTLNTRATTASGMVRSRLLYKRAEPLLGCLGGRAEDVADLVPWNPGHSCTYDSINDLALTPGTIQCGPLQQVFLDRAFISIAGFVVLETLGEFVRVVKDVLDGSGHGCHLRNFGLAGMAWTMKLIPTPSATPISSRRPC